MAANSLKDELRFFNGITNLCFDQCVEVQGLTEVPVKSKKCLENCIRKSMRSYEIVRESVNVRMLTKSTERPGSLF